MADKLSLESDDTLKLEKWASPCDQKGMFGLK